MAKVYTTLTTLGTAEANEVYQMEEASFMEELNLIYSQIEQQLW